MAMLTMAVRSSSVLFSRPNRLCKISFCFLDSNILALPTGKLMGEFLASGIRSGGNAGHRICCMSANSGSEGRTSARLMQMQQLLEEAESRAVYAREPVPKVTLEHVRVGFARSGGPGGQNVNKVNTKVDMRFNVMAACWLPIRVRERIVQMEKNRINSDGELVISSTKTRTQKGNIEDALGKLQAIIDVAAYVPPAPSEEKKKRIKKLAEIEEQRRLQTKKVHSLKKSFRRNKGSWD